jgi:hypothetical protein
MEVKMKKRIIITFIFSLILFSTANAGEGTYYLGSNCVNFSMQQDGEIIFTWYAPEPVWVKIDYGNHCWGGSIYEGPPPSKINLAQSGTAGYCICVTNADRKSMVMDKVFKMKMSSPQLR